MANYSIGQLRGAFAAGRRAAEAEACPVPPQPQTGRRGRAVEFARAELLGLVDFSGVAGAFRKDGTAQEHWPRCLAVEVLRTSGPSALWALCHWLRDRLYDRNGGEDDPEIERATARLECRFIELIEDRRRIAADLEEGAA